MAERTPGLERLDLEAPREEGGEGGAPRHVAIIMDGNHRWAKRRRMPGAAGHRAGARNVRPVAEACADRGVTCLTLFAFSTENWQRPRQEVNLLMDLMRNVMENDLDELHRREVRLQIIGDRSRFPSDLQMEMNRAEAMTRDNSRMALNVAVNFGGRWDIAQAARALGIPQYRIIFGHILPNAIAPVLVTATFGVASAILIESSLSFLGIGDLSVPSWGETLNTGRLEQKLWLILAPGTAIFVVVSVFNLVGEGLRDALDPKLRA